MEYALGMSFGIVVACGAVVGSLSLVLRALRRSQEAQADLIKAVTIEAVRGVLGPSERPAEEEKAEEVFQVTDPGDEETPLWASDTTMIDQRTGRPLQ